MALQVASLFGVLSLKDDDFKTGIKNAKGSMNDLGGQMQTTGKNMQNIGGQIGLVAAPIAAAFGVATDQSMKFDEAVTNTGAVMGWNRDQITAMKTELLTIGAGTRAGPQAVADAMYDIAGGVADASTHMSILNAAIHTSQAGNASLGGTTKALISTMNSYGYSADKATKVSDVLTQVVGKGVGSMDEFASALPQVTGLAASLQIPLEDVGSSMAFLTTKGNSASEASTQLGGIMSALMKPNADMKDALTALGFSSGEAAIKQLGLVGALQAVAGTTTAGEKGMAALLGTQEAVRGSVALMGDDFKGFDETFKQSIDGVTGRAEAIQMGSPAAQFDLLKSSVSEAAIKAGDALTPALVKVWEKMTPIIQAVTDWIAKNPELTSQIGLLAIGGALAAVALSIMGTALTVVGGLLAAVSLPAVLLGLAIAGIVYAADKLYPGGIKKLFDDARTSAFQLGVILFGVGGIAGFITTKIEELVKTILDFKKGVDGIVGITNLVTSGQVTPGQVLGAVGNEIGANAGHEDKYRGVTAKYWGQRAGGGSVMGGGSYLVGEQGPELFTPSTSGNISTAQQTAGMMGGMHIGAVNVYANSYEGGQAAAQGFRDKAISMGYSFG